VTIFYCVECWREMPPEATTCPACGADVERLSSERSYIQKLIAALKHPEPETPVRAAWLLGQVRATEAVPALMRVVQESPDPYLVEAAVEALGQIGDPACRATLVWAAREGAVRVRRAAAEALRRLSDVTKEATESGGM
jgi:HEAT repeat protein